MTGRHVAQAEVVHVVGAGWAAPAAGVGRQRCLWCGALLTEGRLERVELRTHLGLAVGWSYDEIVEERILLAVADGRSWRVSPGEGGVPPAGACWALDPEVTR